MARNKSNDFEDDPVEGEVEGEGEDGSEVDTDTEKLQRFTTLAAKRVDGVCNELDKIVRMATSRAYEYEEAHVDKMFAYIREQVDKAENSFRSKEKASDFSFD